MIVMRKGKHLGREDTLYKQGAGANCKEDGLDLHMWEEVELFQHHPLIVWALGQNAAKRSKKSWLVRWKGILMGWRGFNNK